MSITKNNNEHTNLNTTNSQCGASIPYESIQQSGAYICNWSGHLIRIPADGINSAQAPAVNMIGAEALFVTKISENPFVTATKARLLAANCDLPVNF